MVSHGSPSARGKRRRKRRLRRRIGLIAGSVLVVAALAALIIQPPAFLRASSDATPTPTPQALPTPSPIPSPVSTPTEGSVTDVKNELKARIAVSGDTGMRNAAQARVAQRMAIEAQKEPYDAFIICGDLVYPDGDADLTRKSVIDPYAPVLKDAKLIPALGNHDVQSGEQKSIMSQLGRDSAWYVEKIGPVRVIVLDSTRIGNSQQLAWLRGVLAEKQPEGSWTIAAFHHAPYSSGDHGNDRNVQKQWVPLFEQADIPLVLAGHDHHYERTKEIDGITYVVSGGGSKLRPVDGASFTAKAASLLHYVDLLVYDDRLEGRAITPDGKAIDEFTVKR